MNLENHLYSSLRKCGANLEEDEMLPSNHVIGNFRTAFFSMYTPPQIYPVPVMMPLGNISVFYGDIYMTWKFNDRIFRLSATPHLPNAVSMQIFTHDKVTTNYMPPTYVGYWLNQTLS